MLCPTCLVPRPGDAGPEGHSCPRCGQAQAASLAEWQAFPPLRFLAHDRSLPGLIARRTLLGTPLPTDGALAAGRIRSLLAAQLSGGSWNASIGWTAWYLYELHLLGVGRDRPEVRRALAWIYDRLDRFGEFHERAEVVNSYPTVMGEEQAMARRGIDLHGYLLAHLLPLGVGDEPPIRRATEFLLERYPGGRRCCPRCTANLLAALALVPDDRARAKGLAALAWLAESQRDGYWRHRGGPLFYFTLHGVGAWPEGREIVARAAPLVRQLRQPDGGWGVRARAEKTLLVVTTFARHGLLPEVAA